MNLAATLAVRFLSALSPLSRLLLAAPHGRGRRQSGRRSIARRPDRGLSRRRKRLVIVTGWAMLSLPSVDPPSQGASR
jgi:hypothetical protein